MFAVRNSSITTKGNAQLTPLSGFTKMVNWKDLGLLPKEETGGSEEEQGLRRYVKNLFGIANIINQIFKKEREKECLPTDPAP